MSFAQSQSEEIVSEQPKKNEVNPDKESKEPQSKNNNKKSTSNKNQNDQPGPGLQALETTHMLFIKLRPKLLEACCVCELNNDYDIFNHLGKKIFTAKESTCCLARNCMGPCRPFTIEVRDLNENVCLRIKRPFRLRHCCCPTCFQQMTVLNAEGRSIGYVSQVCTVFRPTFEIQTEDAECSFVAMGACRCLPYCCKTTFKLCSPDGGAVLGKITKKWSGAVKELFTDADNFGVEFPAHLSVNIKATTLSAVFLIDFMYFEEDTGCCGCCTKSK